MAKLGLISLLIFIVAVVMTMAGKGGGNFYVVILTLASLPIHQAATIGQFMLFTASLSALLIFNKSKAISWRLGIFVGGLTALAAFAGGYFSHAFSGFTLKIVFSIMLLIAGGVMLIPAKGPLAPADQSQPWIFRIKAGTSTYTINLWIALPIILGTGFASGMVGVSGGSFLVPLMVLACAVPMQIAVGTASSVITATALMGFTGHALQGDFNLSRGLPLALVTIIGGILGSSFSLKTKPRHLKRLFAYTNWLAAVFMLTNALHTHYN